MASIRLKRIALDDLKGIVRYIAADNPEAARNFRNALYEKFVLLARNPELAPARPDLAPGLRYLPYDNYLIFFLPEVDGITVIRVLHGARHIAPELFTPDLQ
ncbi:MAG: type II toxin-antitoxin system RelE/ParE family toxin [Alphaproteobacteria bacterium]|nr:type II toxin-antitoxin system RelE/ParE family toxin [Alphaproteobacteria bacterium]